MKQDTLWLLKRSPRELSNHSLAQFFAVVLEEMRRRGNRLKKQPRVMGFWETKDREPIRGF